jgi:hypothetical protein
VNRITGHVEEGNYVIRDTSGGVIRMISLDEARADTKLRAAIERNGWEAIPNG